MSHSIRLSVGIVVRDAEPLLAATLESVRELADELVVLDTGSTDGTLAIARQFTPHVFQEPWQDDFAAARNACARHVTGDWILWLDAGETLTATNAGLLKKWLDERPAPTAAHLLFVRVAAESCDVSADQVGRVRLVPNLPGLQFHGRVREHLRPWLESQQLRVVPLPICLDRGATEHAAELRGAKAERNLRLAKRELAEAGPDSRLLNVCGDAMQTLGDARSARHYFRDALAQSVPGSPDMLEAYYGLLTCDDQHDYPDAKVTLCLEALKEFPLDAQLLCVLGGYMLGQGRHELARNAYRTAFEHGQVMPEVWHLEEIHEITGVCYATMLQLARNDAEALNVLQTATQNYPHSQRLRRTLLELCVKFGRRDESLHHLHVLLGKSHELPKMKSAVRGACLAAVQNWIPAKSYLLTAYQAGCRDLLCLRYLVPSLMACGDADTARSVVAEWRRTDPHSTEAKRYLAAMTPASQTLTLDDRKLRVDAAPSGEHLDTLLDLVKVISSGGAVSDANVAARG